MLGVCLSAYFSYHAVAGQRSLARLMQVSECLADVQGDLVGLDGALGELEGRVAMLRPMSLSLDYLEELAMRDLGYYRASELALVSAVQ